MPIASDLLLGVKNGKEIGTMYFIVASAAEGVKRNKLNKRRLKHINMVFDSTHPNEDFDQCALTKLGPAYGLIDRIRMGRIGSRRMMIHSYSEGFWPLKNKFQDILYANIELRPNGIVVYAVNGGKRMGWVVAYHELIIFDSDHFSIHAQGLVIKFEKNRNYTENKSFIRMMMQKRLEYLSHYEMPLYSSNH